jgi:tRNA(fMet)-specific endonuclease VapC
MKYLLDTCILSQFMRGNVGVLERLKSTPPEWIAVSTITCMEVEYGLRLNPQRASKLKPVIEPLLEAVHILPYHREDADATAVIRSILKHSGMPIGPYDVMLAGSAKHHNLVFVTDNLREFQRVEGLLLENWVTR